jgi:hypothetical protein
MPPKKAKLHHGTCLTPKNVPRTHPPNVLTPNSEPDVPKIKEIVEREFELEISLKKAEVGRIMEEIGRTEDLIWRLETAMGLDPSVPAKALVTDVKEDFQLQAPVPTQASREHSVSSYFTESDDSLSRRTLGLKGPKLMHNYPELYACTPEGGFIQLICPDCLKQDFSNIQGLINHSRITHKREIGTHEEATRICGRPVSENVIPLEHRYRLMRPPNSFAPTVDLSADFSFGVRPRRRVSFVCS